MFPPLPPAPANLLDVYTLDSFLTTSSLYHVVLPWCPFRIGYAKSFAPAAAEDSLPPWTVSIERWYQIFHPHTWRVLAEDDQTDVDYLELIKRLKHRQARYETTHAEEWQRWRKLYKKVHDEVWVRRATRWERLYAVHHVRKVFIERKRLYLRKLGADKIGRTGRPVDMLDDSAVIFFELPPGDHALRPAPAPVGSVWPFHLAPPTTLPQPPTVVLYPHHVPLLSFLDRFILPTAAYKLPDFQIPVTATAESADALSRASINGRHRWSEPPPFYTEV
ncbi:hypothetical protein JCM11641_002752, partial [Rhodosporidiobolus odoratus]